MGLAKHSVGGIQRRAWSGDASRSDWQRHFGVFLPSASRISFSNAASMVFAPGPPSHLNRITP